MSGYNGVQGASTSGYSDKVFVPHSDLEVNHFAQQPVREFYGGQSTSSLNNNPFTTQEEKSGLALEKEILEEYSYEAGSKSSDTKASAFALKKGSKVVIKRYTKGAIDIGRANREILALQAISDPAVPVLVDYFDPADHIITVLEEREDESVKRYIEGRGTLSDDMLKAIVTQLFSAIATIFNAQFAHLRITNETLFIDKNGQLIIKDFEFAHKYKNEKVDDLYALVGAKYGSDIFVAPEVFTTSPYNARKAVIWSCGVVLYYMTTGQIEKLSNLEHPANGHRAADPSPAPTDDEAPTHRRRSSLGFRRQSVGARKASISTVQNVVTYPGSRFEVVNWVRDIISKMLIINPRRRAELIEVAAKVPKEFHLKDTRPLMEVAWMDYKDHAGPHAGLDFELELDSSASSIYSAVSNFSNPFGSLLGGRRRSSAAKQASYAEYVSR